MTEPTANSRDRRIRIAVLVLAVGLAAAASGSPGAAQPVEDPSALLRQIRTASLEPHRAVSLRNVEIKVGPAILRVDRGVLFPAEPIDGRTFEFVMIGQARYLLEAPDAIEAAQLELFTGESTLEVPVEEAVLVIAEIDTVDRLLDRPAPREPRAGLVQRALDVYAEWLAGNARRNTGVESGIFRARVGDLSHENYFALWCRSHELGDFLYQFDPEDVEQLTLASFVPVGVHGWDRLRLARHIRIQQRKGRYLGVRLEDIGAWDIWLSAAWNGGRPDAAPGQVGFESRHYDLDVTVRRRTRRLDARARLELETVADGRRVVSLELFRDLQVGAVADETGRPLFFFQAGNELLVLLPEPKSVGDPVTLLIDYSGRPLQWVGQGIYDLRDTDDWYPHCGSIDRATYDVKIRWPASYRLLAAGERVDGGREGNLLWERRRIDRPAIAFSFVMGKFDVERRQVGEIAVRLAFHRTAPRGARALAAETVVAALEFLQRRFGPYLLDELTVVTLPRDYSQSYLGFVTLADSVLEASTVRPPSAGLWVRETTIAHELAHQWWGNQVGWWSYRDQWLSEAMANYAGLLFYADSRGQPTTSLTRLSVGWRDTLESTLRSGRTVESLGPIVLGNRLNSSKASNGYQAIVYRKGAVVLAMLARAVGEERFLEMMRSLLEAADGRVLTTEQFLESIERMSGLELQGFARQYVYGTGIPLVFYDYQIEPRPTDGWLVRGQARRRQATRYLPRVTRLADGAWDLENRAPRPGTDPQSALMVPFRMAVSSPEETLRRPVQLGQLLLQGPRESFEIETVYRPTGFRLDPEGETLARFVSAESDPKRYRRYEAEELLVEGRKTEAEALLREALETPATGEPPPYSHSWMFDPENQELLENTRIRLLLVRLYLDQRRDAEAWSELDGVDESLAGAREALLVERAALRARVEIRRGDFASAHRRLKRLMRAVAPSRFRGNRLRYYSSTRTQARVFVETLTLFAIAAAQVGNGSDYEWAAAAAKARGADLTVLERFIALKAG